MSNNQNDRLKHFLFCLIILASFTIPAFCQSDSSAFRSDDLLINRLDSPIRFDGIPDDSAWYSINPIKLIMHSPVFGKEPSESTEVLIGYNNDYLYIAARLMYNDPDMISSVSLKRDYMGMGCDWFGVILDTFNDKENGMAFFTTPDGLRFDANIQRDAYVFLPDQQPMNISWNTFWDVITEVSSDGWTTEMRIPVSSLRFQQRDGEVRMGMILQRWIPSKNEMDVFPAIPPNWGATSTMKPSQAREIIMHGLEPGKPLYIAPYLLGGFESSYNLYENETVYTRADKPEFEAGIDIKYGISKGLVLDVTANTDFAQVESDDQQINLTRYSLYFPEKRMFFLERSSVFDFSFGGNSNLFYSRRIGLSDDEENPKPVRIYGGARITGRINRWDVGIMDMQTAPLWEEGVGKNAGPLIHSENFGALRFRRQIINPNSYIGTMVTSRLGTDGSYNLAYGIDGTVKVFGDDYLNIRWSQTFEDSIQNSSLKDPTLFMATWERRAEKGFSYGLGYTQSGIHFNPGIGFEMMDDYTVMRINFGYGWIPGEKSKLFSHTPETRIMYRTYIDDGSMMSFTNYTGWTFQTKNQWQGSLNLVYNIDNLRDSLEIIEDEAYVPPGHFEYMNFMGNFSSPMSRSFFTMIRAETGQYFDGSRISIRLMPTWNISRHLELGGTYNFDHVRFKSRGEEMTNHIIGFKALYMLNTRLSFNAYIQYNTALNGIITNLRFRYNPKEGNDLYLVFNEDRNTNLYREMPNLPVYNSRAVMLKYTYTFNL